MAILYLTETNFPLSIKNRYILPVNYKDTFSQTVMNRYIYCQLQIHPLCQLQTYIPLSVTNRYIPSVSCEHTSPCQLQTDTFPLPVMNRYISSASYKQIHSLCQLQKIHSFCQLRTDTSPLSVRNIHPLSVTNRFIPSVSYEQIHPLCRL